jgi:phosphoglycolate phosphatase-like HAD superfamily hydrolase
MTYIHEDIELLNPHLSRGKFRSVLFDFDGTLSLIREGWPQVMIPMMVEILRQTGTKETDEELNAIVKEFVSQLTGRQTIYQMMRLAEEVQQRGGQARDPLEYKHQYLDLLMQRINHRIQALQGGEAKPVDWAVPGTHDIVREFKARGMTLYLASGTDLPYVRKEAGLLGLKPFFEDNIYGALDDFRSFSKKMVIERIINEHRLQGEELLGFGDGYVEIEEVKKAGGVAVAVATDEVRRRGIDAWKRERLVRAGADIVIPDFRCAAALVKYLFAEA